MYDTRDLAYALKIDERHVRVWLRKKWRQKILTHVKGTHWEFNQNEFSLLCYVYLLERA